MDRTERYREIVTRLVEDYGKIQSGVGQVQTRPVIDRERDTYQVVYSGWNKQSRIQGTAIHIDIIEGKVWLQFNGTDQDIAEELVTAGIPREDIVLAFLPEDVRHHTGYAVK
jgi:hypothetical protein